jgi:TonB family protein
MNELSSVGAVVEITSAAPAAVKWLPILRKLLFVLVLTIVFSSVNAQPPGPVRQPPPPRAVYTPKPVYRPEWVKQGLKGKGVIMVTIDKVSGNVTGARVLTSTGNPQLDGAALQAYSKWRFDPRTVAVPQLTIPIEFTNRPPAQPARHTLPQAVTILIVLVLAGGAIAMFRRKDA